MTKQMPGWMLRDHANLADAYKQHIHDGGESALGDFLRDEAARREDEGMKLRDIAPNETVRAAIDKMASDGVVFVSDAPPPPAPFVTDHKWLDPECHASGCQTLILKAELEKLRDQRDKYMWQVRDTCRRAEAAEAREKRLREALVRVDALDPDVPDACMADALRGLVMRMGEIARAALAGGNDGQAK